MDLDLIFKAYDVRGTVPDQLDEEAARRIGIGFAGFAGADRIAVGRDCRVSSPALARALIEGITSQGVDVEVLGEITTDMVYFVSGAHDEPGVMITASHNPGEWNGLKFCLAGAAPVGEESGLVDVKRIAADPPGPVDAPGSVSEYDPRDRYVDHLFGIVDAGAFAPMRVAADGGNGMAGVVLSRVFDRIPTGLTGLYLQPDGTFPNHPADPLQEENLADLLDLMGRELFDVGVAFDGDADRAFFVDDRKVPLPGSTTTAIIARWFLSREPGATIVHNLICSRAVPEIILEAGGTPIRTRVGHSFIKQVMKETGALFGGEHSGHYYFRDNYRADSGILAMLVLLQVLSEDGRPLSELRTDSEPDAQSGEVNLDVADKRRSIEAVAEAFPDGEADRLDGLTLSWDDHWFNLRPSNTEPVLRLNVEAPDREAVAGLVAAVRRVAEEA
jgi:phosphomannomutase